MTSTAPPLLMIFAEDTLCFRLARDLADRVFHERAPDAWYLDDWSQHKDNLREWRGINGGSWTGRAELKDTFEAAGLHLDTIDAPQGAALHALKAYKLAAIRAHDLRPRTCVLFVALDADRQGELRAELEARLAGMAPRGAQRRPLLAVLAVPVPEAEAWVLSGFECENGAEKARLSALKATLKRAGFPIDPVTESHRLGSTTRDAKDTKKCLAELSGEPEPTFAKEGGRCEKCWLDAPLDLLEQRGQHNGLAAYLAEVQQEVVPIVGGSG